MKKKLKDKKYIEFLQFFVGIILFLSTMYLWGSCTASDRELITSSQFAIRGFSALVMIILSVVTIWLLDKGIDKEMDK